MHQELILKDEVYAIVGAAIEVHRQLKNGFLEAIYQEAMEIELAARGIPFVPQSEIAVFYKGVALRKRYVADLLCYGQILIEIKVLERLGTREQAQILNYMNATRLKLGLLINFGDAGRLDWERLVL